jgi:hypothetical protein
MQLEKVSHVIEHPANWTDEGAEVKLQAFFMLGTTKKLIGQFHNPTAFHPLHAPEKRQLVPAGGAQNLFYTLRKSEKALPLSEIEIRVPRLFTTRSSHYTDISARKKKAY